jgi:4'-phosphopantetheinyl transferase EntD
LPLSAHVRHSLVAQASDLPHGRCVALRIPSEPDALLQYLPSDEASHASVLAPARRRTWAAGRLALRFALADRGIEVSGPILSSPRGAPLLEGTPGIRASISHKDTLAVGLVASAPPGRRAFVGIDLEGVAPRRYDIAERILTPPELALVAALPAADRQSRTLLHFAIKEAIYKAVDPILQRFVSWSEVSLDVQSITKTCGSARVQAAFPGVVIAAQFQRLEGHWLATATATFDDAP